VRGHDRIIVEFADEPSPAHRPFEVVERKGLGHPDSICDHLVESMATALGRAYQQRFGSVPHFNLENAYLAAGRAEPAFGGGQILQPMRFFYGDTATARVGSSDVPVREIVEAAAMEWIRGHLRRVDPEKHMQLVSCVHEGSASLVDCLRADAIRANDTCVAIAHAPLTPVEDLTLRLETLMQSDAWRRSHPAQGEDVKVTVIRRARSLVVRISAAFVGACLADEGAYWQAKADLSEHVREFLGSASNDGFHLDVAVNTLDRPGSGAAGLHVTVLGLSAENGDGGEVGRGNRLSGLNPLSRVNATGSVAGKHPLGNPGKVLGLLASRMADRIHREADGVDDAVVTLVAEIGGRLDEPLVVHVRTAAGAPRSRGLQDQIREIARTCLSEVTDVTTALVETGWRIP
jgi:S-adenosylmethionine synthetase